MQCTYWSGRLEDMCFFDFYKQGIGNSIHTYRVVGAKLYEDVGQLIRMILKFLGLVRYLEKLYNAIRTEIKNIAFESKLNNCNG